MGNYGTAFLFEKHSAALMDLAWDSGLLPDWGSPPRNRRRTRVHRQVIDCFLLHDAFLVDHSHMVHPDTINEAYEPLRSEGIEIESVRTSYLKYDFLRSKEAWDIEKALLVEPLMVRRFWRPVQHEALRRCRLSTRRHIWRLLCLAAAFHEKDQLLQQHSYLYDETLRWRARHEDIWHIAVEELFGSFVNFDMGTALVKYHDMAAADSHNACAWLDEHDVAYEVLTREDVLKRISSLPRDAVGTFKVAIGRETKGHFPDLSLTDVVRLRSNGLLCGLRECIDAVISSVQKGELNASEAAAKEAQRVMAAVRRQTPLKHLGKVLTYVGIPVSLIEVCTGIVGPGLALALAGGALQVHVERKERALGWLVDIGLS